MLFHSVTITVPAILTFRRGISSTSFKGMVGKDKMDWEGFISVVLYSLSMFSETFS